MLVGMLLVSQLGEANPRVNSAKPSPKATTPKAKTTPTKPVVQLHPSRHAEAFSFQPPIRNPIGTPSLGVSEPLPTPNIIENVLQTPSPDVVKASPSLTNRFRLQNGCAPIARSITVFTKELEISDVAFNDAFDRQVPNFFKNLSAKCIPYAISLSPSLEIQAISLLNNERRDKSTTLVTIHKSPNTGIYLVDSQALGQGFEHYLEIVVDLNNLVVYKANQATTSIPPELVWELASLVKELYPKLTPNQQHFARVIYDAGDKNTWAQVISLEILDENQNTVLADAFWVQREDLPGGFFTSRGVELEQNFWINPLNYSRISRGVGNFASTSTRSTVVRRGKKNVVVTQSYTSYTGHQGIDFAAPTGTPIYAVANGKIIHYGVMSGYGNLVIVEHPGNYKTYYGHLSAFNPELAVGSEIRRGLEIGYVGSTGRSTGPHLHFELRKNNVYLNPLSNGLELDLWSLRDVDQDQLTKNIVLFSSAIKPQ